MKRKFMLIITLIFVLAFKNNIYADENYENEVVSYNGKFILTFLDNYSTPIKGVEIEVKYLSNDEWKDIHNVEEIKSNIDLVSDVNGVIVINKLPFGSYEYNIKNVPDGYTLNMDMKQFVITIMQMTINEQITLDIDSQFAEDVNEEIEEEKEEVEVVITEIIDDVKNEEDIVEEKINSIVVNISDEEKKNSLNTTINTLSNEIYEYDNTSSLSSYTETEVNKVQKDEKIKEKIIQKTIVDIREKIKNVEQTMIKRFQEYKLSDCIRIAINNIDNNLHTYRQLLSDIPNNDKDKKIKAKNILSQRIIDIDKIRAENMIKASIR